MQNDVLCNVVILADDGTFGTQTLSFVGVSDQFECLIFLFFKKCFFHVRFVFLSIMVYWNCLLYFHPTLTDRFVITSWFSVVWYPQYFRYLLILFRDAPVEVWAMTKNPIMVSWFYVLKTPATLNNIFPSLPVVPFPPLLPCFCLQIFPLWLQVGHGYHKLISCVHDWCLDFTILF